MNNLHGRHWRISLTRLEHGKAEGWISFQSCAETLGCSDTHARTDARAATQLLLGLLHTIWLLMPPLGLPRLLSNRHTSKHSQASPAATGSSCASRARAECRGLKQNLITVAVKREFQYQNYFFLA